MSGSDGNNIDEFLGGLRDAKGNSIPLAKLKVRVEVFGLVAQVTTQCVYKNETGKKIEEVIFNYPLKTGAALFDFRAQIAEKFTIAEIKGKEEAKKHYNEALQQGKSAALLTEDNNHSDIFEMRLGGFEPGEAILSFTFAEILRTFRHEDNIASQYLQFRYPCIHGSRYIIDQDDGSITLKGSGENNSFQFNFSLFAHGASRLVGRNFDFSVSDGGLVTESNDFVKDVIVHIERDEAEPFALIEPGIVAQEGFLGSSLAMVNFLPKAISSAESSSQELIFIVDRSGSMAGGKMSDARKTLKTFLQNLPDVQSGYLFNIVSFGSGYECMWERSQPCSQSNLARALKAVRGFGADMGGTNLLEPLKYVLDQKPRNGSRNIILVTDGDVMNKEPVLSYCKSKRGKNTIFGFGIGTGASEDLVKGCADEGLGLMIRSSKQLEESVKLALDVIQGEVYKNIEVAFNLPAPYGAKKLEYSKTLLPGCLFTVFAEITRAGKPVRRPIEEDINNIPKGECMVKAIDPDGEEKYWSVPLVLAVRPPYDTVLVAVDGNRYLMDIILSYTEPGSPIHRIAAKRMLLQLSIAGSDKKNIEILSTQTNVLSSITSFVMTIDGEEKKQEAILLKEKPVLSTSAMVLKHKRKILQAKAQLSYLGSAVKSTNTALGSSMLSAPQNFNSAPKSRRVGGLFSYMGSKISDAWSVIPKISMTKSVEGLGRTQSTLEERAPSMNAVDNIEDLQELMDDSCQENDMNHVLGIISDFDEDDLLEELAGLEEEDWCGIESAEIREMEELNELHLLKDEGFSGKKSSADDPVSKAYSEGEHEISSNPAKALLHFQKCIELINSGGQDKKNYFSEALLAIVRILLLLKKPKVEVAEAVKQHLSYLSKIPTSDAGEQEFLKLTTLLEKWNQSVFLQDIVKEFKLGLPEDQQDRLDLLMTVRDNEDTVAHAELKKEDSIVEVDLNSEDFSTFKMVYTATVMRVFGKEAKISVEMSCEILYKELKQACITRVKWSSWVKKRLTQNV